jgi:hypothetical protein
MLSKEDIRADFMKRWFAVAVSVGFASTIVTMPTLQTGEELDFAQQEQIARLAVAMIATLLSWEGYLLSINKKPLIDFLRFAIDVVLVLIYLILLLTSKFSGFWLWLHAITFSIYVAWDVLSIRQFRRQFVTDEAPGDFQPTVWQVYWGGLRNNLQIYRGPVITLFWAAFFWTLPFAYPEQVPGATFFFAAFVLWGLVMYRLDKHYRWGIGTRMLAVAASVALVVYVSWSLETIRDRIISLV